MTAVAAARDLYEELDTIAQATRPGESFDRSALDAIATAGLNGVAVPKALGGADLPLVEAVDVWAELSRADGSIGWCSFAADSALAYFGAYLDDEGIGILMDGRPEGSLPVVAGQFAPNGAATADGDDWLLDGDYQFGSGIVLADFAGAGFFATPADGGDAAYLMGCFPQGLIDQKGNWEVLGLRATQSIDYGVHGVRVPRVSAFDFFTPTVHRGSAKHYLGVLPLTAAGHAGWALGVARRMLDELTELARTKTRMGATAGLADSEYFLINLARLESRHRAARAWVAEVCEQAEAECEARGDFVSVPTANLVRQACVHANRDSVELAREAYTLAGTSALREGPLQKCFRDLHAGGQHYFASDAPSVEYGQTLVQGKDSAR
ncbi:MAG: hypothetical protein GY812_04760 [Actinomycetia bacterium]|nr:hypothetical protein [Actinomycetes bacterium]